MKLNHSIFDLCGDGIYLQIAAVLRKAPGGVSGRGIAGLLPASTFKTHHALKFLETQGVLKSAAAGKALLYQLNQDHILVQKILLPLLDFQDNIYTELGNEIMAPLRPKPVSIILYGSVARGEERSDSDLDLFLVYKEEQKTGRLSEKELWMEKITRKYGNFVSVRRGSVLQLQQARRGKDELMRNIIKEGKVIAGLSMTDLLTYGR